MKTWQNIILFHAFIEQLGSLLAFSPKGSGYIKDRLQNGEQFDFIVGGGTAGCAVAARLAESGEHTVLLIEAGGLPHPDLSIPALTPRTLALPNVLKVYPGVRQDGAAIAANGSIPFIRGNMLGGGSGVNAQVINRGCPHSYNDWAKLTGDASWGYVNMLNYFRKYENYLGDHPSDQRGTDGPITVTRPKYGPGRNEWLQAGRELGYEIGEPNSPQKISFTPKDFTKRNGRRVSSYSGYIEPMLRKEEGKSNLIILINTEVNRILFEGKRAIGVNFTSAQSKGFAKAKKEVIICAGVIDSPVLLMRSGIGPKSVLTGTKIPTVKILEGVGRNLHDNVMATIVVALGNKSAAFDQDTELTPRTMKLFEETGDGPYSFSGCSAQSFIGSSVLPPEERKLDWSDLQLLPKMSNARSGSWDRDRLKDLREGEIAVPWPVFMVRPKSRGTVTLNPKDIDGNPLIDVRYLTNSYDLQALVDGLKIYVDICENTTTFRNVGCRVIDDRLAACNQHEYRSNSYWECYGRQKTNTGLHVMGTCRMGRGPEDPKAVVDSTLRVIGIDGLRVADGSVMPATNGNPMAVIYAIAEKAADMILQK